jgi:hypothetical protein
MGAVPPQVPVEAVRAWPRWAVPEMVGTLVFAGPVSAAHVVRAMSPPTASPFDVLAVKTRR